MIRTWRGGKPVSSGPVSSGPVGLAASALKKFSDAPLKVKILALLFAALALPFALAIQLIGSNYAAVDSFRRDVDVYAAVNNLKTANVDNLRFLGEFLESGSMDDLHGYNDAIDRTVAAYKAVESGGDDLEAAFLAHAIWNSFDSWYEEAHSAIRRKMIGSGDFYAPYYRAERIGRYLDGYISQLLDRTLIVGTETYRARVAGARTARAVAIATLVGVAGLCVGLGLFFSGFVARPLRRLAAAAARMAANEPQVEAVPVESGDEVGQLTVAFNSMNGHIVALVRDLKETAVLERRLHREELRASNSEKMRKEAEFLALQSRINPHFLFNSLNTISRDVMLRGGERAIELIDSLSALLRYGLERGSGIVSLATELEIVRKYAFIQAYRFDNRVSIAVECKVADPEAVSLPAFSVQPLVENAFIHGLEPSVGGGSIRVEAFERGSSVVVRVADDGIGISPERLRAIRSSRAREEGGHTSSIGLSNVRERMRLFTGDRSSFRIRNGRERGTTAEIVLRGAAV